MGLENTQFSSGSFNHHRTIHVDLTGRPVRDTAIGHDDILNLKIALNTTNDVNDFLAVIK